MLATDSNHAAKDLQMSFKNTSSLANGLTKERVYIQSDL
jgi:hypothetical protein